ncbi:D-alanyl-D-alanine carboxypeptidase, partial [Streptococcus pyogenes]
LAETFEAYNYSLPGSKYGIEGVDGLKTGSSPQAGFNSIVTAKRGDTRLITVVLGVGNWADQDGEYYRHYFVNTLLEHTFAT